MTSPVLSTSPSSSSSSASTVLPLVAPEHPANTSEPHPSCNPSGSNSPPKPAPNSFEDHETAISAPVPTTPLPTEHITVMAASTVDSAAAEPTEQRQARPMTPRASSDPTSASTGSSGSSGSELAVFSSPATSPLQLGEPRNRSPYSRNGHFRSHSSSGATGAPPMARANSLPTMPTSMSQLSLSTSPSPSLIASSDSPFMRPVSPLRSPARVGRSPFRTSFDDLPVPGGPGGPPSRGSEIGSISEEDVLDLTPKHQKQAAERGSLQNTSSLSALPSLHHSNSFPRRRRPASPLHQMSSASIPGQPSQQQQQASSTHSSPLLSATRFNEPFPHYAVSLSSTSSVPSTPTSMRSRSPSISSLETIPDSPDAEEAAIEADRIARLKAAAEHENSSSRSNSLEVPSGRGGAFGGGFGGRDKRKRWSVCGAERRGDLDLETIWED
ncbi:hypothetical protein BDY21DRAFT_375138 [Lineolata rhizophorae]|uniref:Basic proline-rich protein n=1 Tax=Lineolata rhizophorae TaxID=578093 RepID=A0A6A6NMK6_9PEZI|nr:hypothetical protein BDY21DRAFT_375138 [Lineolata rhizophorae]